MKATLFYTSLLAAAFVLSSCSSHQAHAPYVAQNPTCCIPQSQTNYHVYSNQESKEVVQKQLDTKRKMLQEIQEDVEAERTEHAFVETAAPDLYKNQDYQWVHGQILTDHARKAKELSSDISDLSRSR